ncbi:MAG: hypothetical protein JXA81_11585 [Sedimentisphaerales bacterium]|nr:hypothetical protein [Sedimentisphaerales bacterium]
MIDKVVQDRMCRSTGGRMVVVYSMNRMYGRRLYYIMDFANNRWCSAIDKEGANLYSAYPDVWTESALPSGFGVDTCPGYSILAKNVSLKISPQRPVRLIDGDVLLVEYRGEIYSVRAMDGQVGVTKMHSE